MITCADIREIIKSENLGIEKFYCGKIDYKYEKAICVYDLQNEARRNIAVGGKEETTDKKKFTILIRWNKNYTETEIAAQNLYDSLTNLNHTSYDNIELNYIEMLNNAPIDLHCGDDGIYERTIDFLVYYNKED